MKNNKTKIARFALLAGGVALAPTLSTAATPRAMLEKSATYALDGTVHAFSLPTVDSTGKIKFYDVDVELVVNLDGTITKANVTKSVLSPVVTTRKIVPGTYQETGGTDKCTVKNLTLTNGRIESAFKCSNGTAASNVFEFTVVNGPVSAGHPFQAELVARGVNLKPDVATYSWGWITSANALFLGACNTYFSGFPIGIKTDGSRIIVSLFTNDGSTTVAPTFSCGNTLNKLP